jgi:hypothetical protein
VLCPADHGLRRAGEAVAKQHSGMPAATLVRLRVGMQ